MTVWNEGNVATFPSGFGRFIIMKDIYRLRPLHDKREMEGRIATLSYLQAYILQHTSSPAGDRVYHFRNGDRGHQADRIVRVVAAESLQAFWIGATIHF